MINVNLLPGAKKKARGRSSSSGFSGFSGFSALGPALAGIGARVKDPYLAVAVVGVVASGLFMGGTYVHQVARESALVGRRDTAVADSTRFEKILRERATAVAQRDSVVQQLRIIRAMGNDRFIWPHVMDEVSRALPPYTWLTSLQQTSASVLSAQGAPKADTAAAKPGAAKAKDAPAARDTVARPALKFRIVGNTVDIQALTRFMKDLEASPFVQGVTLNKTTLIPVDGKEVTQFELDCEYQTPDPAAIQTVAVTTEVR